MFAGHAAPGQVVASCVAVTVAAACFVIVRLYARFIITRSAGWDDGFIVISLISAVATAACMVIQAHTGMGRHIWEIPPSEAQANVKAFWVSIMTYGLSLTCTKISILLQYLRLFPQKWFRISAWTIILIVGCYNFFAIFTTIFMCTPVAKFWDMTITGGHCLDRFAIWFSNAGLSIATDLAIAILPLPVLKQLKLPTRQRRALMFVFAVGGFTCVISIARLQSLYAISRSHDVTWENPLAAIWSMVEIDVAIICSCLPTLRCIFSRWLRNNQSSLMASGSLPFGGPMSQDYLSATRSQLRAATMHPAPTTDAGPEPKSASTIREAESTNRLKEALKSIRSCRVKESRNREQTEDRIELGSEPPLHRHPSTYVVPVYELDAEKRPESPMECHISQQKRYEVV